MTDVNTMSAQPEGSIALSLAGYCGAATASRSTVPASIEMMVPVTTGVPMSPRRATVEPSPNSVAVPMAKRIPVISVLTAVRPCAHDPFASF